MGHKHANDPREFIAKQPGCPRPDKVAYPNKATAKCRFKYLYGKGSEFTVYRCTCGLWHIGHR